MSSIQFKQTFFFLLVLLVFTTGIESQHKQPLQRSPCPDTRPWTGRYRNYVYGFSVVIPRGLKGYWNSARCVPDDKYGCVCMGDHGRFIPLSKDSNIDVFVGYQMESDRSVRDEENQAISYLTNEEKNEHVEIVHSRWLKLGSLNARRFVARYVRDDIPMITDHIIAIHDGVEYELILDISPNNYAKDRKYLEKLITTWKLTPRV